MKKILLKYDMMNSVKIEMLSICLYTSLLSMMMLSCSIENKKDETILNVKQNTLLAEDKELAIPSNELLVEGSSIQTFELETNKKQIIKGANGTIVTFPRNCFGKMSGKITIELIECYSIPKMLFNGLSTLTDNHKLLESDGMIYLNAFNQSGDTPKITRNKIKIQIPNSKKKSRIKLFKGVENTNGMLWNLSHIGFEEATPKMVINYDPVKGDTIDDKLEIEEKIKNENLLSYVFQVSQLGWINCDRYVEGETRDLIVNINPDNKNASFYLVLSNYNSILQGRLNNEGKIIFQNLPVSEPFTLVGFGYKDETLYFNIVDFSSNEETIEFPELEIVSRQKMTDDLFGKFGKDIWNRDDA